MKISKKYKNLCRRVSEINQDAACYMILCAPKLKSFAVSHKLDEVFLWRETVQGFGFWRELFLELKVY